MLRSSFLFGFSLFLLASCTDPQAFYRMVDPGAGKCAEVYRLGEANRENRKRGPKPDDPMRCFLQAHALPEFTFGEPTGANLWQDEAAARGYDLRQSRRYHLAFVEMSDANDLHLPAQMTSLRRHLRHERRNGRNNYVVTYVHGWRHDAELKDRDVENFRVVLAYARAALNSRCVARGEYCDTTLTGVFASWRGRQFSEPPAMQGRGGDPFIVGAGLTFWNRLDKSAELGRDGGALSRVLDQLDGTLTRDPASKRADKHLIVGHSMGGNMLAHLMEGRVLEKLDQHRAPPVGGFGREFRPVLGDLVVLLNPAAKAAKWTSIQRLERKRAGLGGVNFLTSNDGGEAGWDRSKSDLLRTWRGLYPFSQRPVYVSMTSTSNWFLGAGRARVIESDQATGRLFTIGQKVAGARAREDRIAIGHLMPSYRPSRVELIKGAEPVGVSHEFIVRQGAVVDHGDGRRRGVEARYAHASDPRLGWCEPANGWLWAARDAARVKNGQKQIEGSRARFDHFWAYGEGTENIAPGRNGASVLWRHQINLNDGKRGLSVVPGTSPFWNVRVFDTAIRGHNKWVNYPMFCALNQLVLDDVTARNVDGNVPRILDLQPDQDVGAAAN